MQGKIRSHRRCLALLFSLCFVLSLETLAGHCKPGFIAREMSHHYSYWGADAFRSRIRRWLVVRAFDGTSKEQSISARSRIPESLVQSLDLAPVIRLLSKHAGTRRGREAILGLIGEERDAERQSFVSEPAAERISSKRRRVLAGTQIKSKNREAALSRARQSLAPIAVSSEQARKEYELVEQATLALGESNGLTVPPLYGATSSPWDTDTEADTDHDEWLKLSLEEWTLEHVLQADQVVQTLLRVHEWGIKTETQTWVPGLSDIAQTVSEAELRQEYQKIQGSVDIVKKRSFIKSQAMVSPLLARKV